MTEYTEEFLKKNKLTAISQVTTNAGGDTDLNKLKLLDKKAILQWGSISKTSANWTIDIAITEAVDRIILMNHNFASFTIKYDTSNNFSTAISVSGSTATNHYFRFNSVTPSTNINIVVTALQGSDTIARLGQLIITETIFNMSSYTSGRSHVVPSVSQVLTKLSDGAYQKDFKNTLYGFRINLESVTLTERANYKTVYDYNRLQPFFFIKRPDDGETWDGVAGHVHWANADEIWDETDGLKANGYNVSCQLVPAGGIG